MVELGPLSAPTCPNGPSCPHDIEDHRYEPDKQRWVCTSDDCRDNPYRVIRVSDLAGQALTMAGFADLQAIVHALNGPEVTIQFGNEPPPSSADLGLLGEEYARRERRRRLGLKWWQR